MTPQTFMSSSWFAVISKNCIVSQRELWQGQSPTFSCRRMLRISQLGICSERLSLVFVAASSHFCHTGDKTCTWHRFCSPVQHTEKSTACSLLCSVHWTRCWEVPMFPVLAQAELVLAAPVASLVWGTASQPECQQRAQLSNHSCHCKEHPPSI